MKKNRIYTIGETTYDIVFQEGIPKTALVGGSMLNTSVSLGRLGLPVSFISRMGNDKIGDLSIHFLNENNVDTSLIARFEGNSRISLAFLDEMKNATYQFYKGQEASELHFPKLSTGDMVLFGSTQALHENGRNELLLFLKQARDLEVITLYDPNIRNFSPQEMPKIKKKVEENILLTKILKGSVTDFQMIYHSDDPDTLFSLANRSGAEVLVLTSAQFPVELRTKDLSKSYPVPEINPISTIGAGDTFSAGLMYGFSRLGIGTEQLRNIKEEQWDQIIAYAISFSSAVCLSKDNYISREFVYQARLR